MRQTLLPAALLIALSCFASATSAQKSDAPYEVEVWADVSYDVQGRAVEVSFPQKDAYPAAFIENLRQRLAAEAIEPRQSEGQAATFETGVRITMTVTPAAGAVTVDSVDRLPRVVRMTDARLPDDLVLPPGWDGVVQVRCLVTRKGRCSEPALASAPGMVPEEAARIAKASMGGWRFVPQKLNGKPIDSEAVVPFSLTAEGVARPTLRGRSYEGPTRDSHTATRRRASHHS